MIDKPGIYDIPAEAYHADPCPAPSLSSSIAKLLVEKSPRHAKLAHPRLNPNYAPKNRTIFDIGSAAHAMVLGDERRFVIVDADDWKTKAAQAERAAAYAAGKIPLLPHQWEECRAMALAARAQLDASEEDADAFTNGKPEQTLIWQEDGIWCRIRLDWLTPGSNVFRDYKTTGASAHPDQWGRKSLYDTGAIMQAGFYRRGIKAVLGIENAHFRFVVQETEAPYALSVIGLSPSVTALADLMAAEAVRIWTWCTQSNRWPGYPKRVAYPDLPVWQERAWEDRKVLAEQVKESDGRELLEIAFEWQAPQLENRT